MCMAGVQVAGCFDLAGIAPHGVETASSRRDGLGPSCLCGARVQGCACHGVLASAARLCQRMQACSLGTGDCKLHTVTALLEGSAKTCCLGSTVILDGYKAQLLHTKQLWSQSSTRQHTSSCADSACVAQHSQLHRQPYVDKSKQQLRLLQTKGSCSAASVYVHTFAHTHAYAYGAG